MGRLLLLAAAIVGLIWLVRRAVSDRPRGSQTPTAEIDALVRCAHCGVHVPRQDAHPRDERAYCSADHAERGPGPESS